MGARGAVDVEKVRAKLKAKAGGFLNSSSNGYPPSVARKALKEHLRQVIRTLPGEEFRALAISRQGEEDYFIDTLINETLGAGPLDDLLRDASINEIMINGPAELFIERAGRLEQLEPRFRDSNHLMAAIERMLDPIGASVNESNPVCDATLPDGSRVNIIIPPLVLNGPVVTIRRKLPHWEMSEYVRIETIDAQAAEFLQACVKAKINMVFSGGTSTGKTTLVAILSQSIPATERIVTIENTPELELIGRAHWIRMVARQPNLEGRGEIPLRTLVRNALRMRPDRIILGEARGGEALDVVQAMHSGHDGFMTVLHASSGLAALERLQTLMQLSGVELSPSACRMQIASAVELIIHMSRFVDGSRRISAITQVLGSTQDGFQLEDLFAFQSGGFSPEGKLLGVCRSTGARPKFLQKFHLNNVKVPGWVTT